MRRALGLGVLLAVGAWGVPLAESVERLIASSPVARGAFWGIQVVDLESGKTIYEFNSDHLFVPASNAKLFTSALALLRLGPDHTFRTRVLAGAAPDAAGVVAGNLVLAGGGDPNLSGRVLPYRTGSAGVTGNPLAALEDLANQVAGRGVTRIDGDLVGDDTWYVWEPYVAGWALEDTVSDDGAPVSALAVNDNLVTLTVRPAGRAGEMALLSWRPLGETYAVENRVRTVASGERSLRLERLPGSRGAVLSGSVPLRDRGADFVLGVDDPALHAATLFRRLLEERGITITGQTLARHRDPAEVADLVHGPAEPAAAGNVELAARTSAPLLEELRVMDKVSQNLHAEMALRAVAKARRGVGSREAGVDEMKTFLGEVGIEPSAAHLVDGSGLARLNLVSPSAVVKLLRYVYATPERDRWIALLPVGGTDGTLSTRFGDSAAAGKVHAKTGSLNSVSALSGYIERPSGMVAFSILVNNYNGAAAEVRAVIDRICTLLSE